MALPVVKITSLSRFQQDSALLQRPMMLKDFLRDDKSNKPRIVLLRSFSKKAKISAIQKVIKLFQIASLKPPSVLPRSFSRKSARRSKSKNHILDNVPEVKVKVKDILRWRSFRDMAEDNRNATATATATAAATTTTSSCSSCSKRSSWCDSDFTAEELPPWGGENNEFWGKKAATLKSFKGEWLLEEYEQQSPVSVLDSPFREVEGFTSPPHPILSNIQGTRCKLTRRIQEHKTEGKMVVSEGVNAAEEKARELLSYVKRDMKRQDIDDQVILDFFMHELTINGKLHDGEFDLKLLRIAESWINGEFDESYEWELEEKRESYVRDMEKSICWNNFKQEEQLVSKELEILMLDDLIHHLLVDFLVISEPHFL